MAAQSGSRSSTTAASAASPSSTARPWSASSRSSRRPASFASASPDNGPPDSLPQLALIPSGRFTRSADRETRPEMSRFTGTVLITGATAGIGAACARAFAAEGARLLLAARRTDRLEALAAELREAHGTETHLVALDVRDAGVVSMVLEHLPPEWSAIDVLVNNAGLARGLATIQEGEFRDWEEMIDTNVKGVLYVTRAVLPGMVERGRGHVINIGSIVANEIAPRAAVYSAT